MAAPEFFYFYFLFYFIFFVVGHGGSGRVQISKKIAGGGGECPHAPLGAAIAFSKALILLYLASSKMQLVNVCKKDHKIIIREYFLKA